MIASVPAKTFKGLYIARIDLGQEHLRGVAGKIRAQVAALATAPATVELAYPAIKSTSGPFQRRADYYLRFYLHCARATNLDFVYLRYQGCSPLVLWMLARLRRRNPGLIVFVEIPSYPYDAEAVTRVARIKNAIDRMTRGWLRAWVDWIVTFSREASVFGVPTIRTENGVDTAEVGALPGPPPGDGIRLLGLANLSFWHGYDRAIAGLEAYYAEGGQREVFLDLVGTGAELPKLRALAAASGLEGHVTFHGPRGGAALEAIMANAHVALSSLGIHRVQMDSTTIKAREYCARGLPFVLGAEDRDFPETLPFVLRVPRDDTPVRIVDLLAFHDRLAVDGAGVRRAMRDYAERNLTWTAKMQPVLAALRASKEPEGVSDDCHVPRT